jgi:hypothetical protein
MCEHAWHKLRSPFVLPPASIGFHECEYETFDMGLAGCLLCGRVHRCAQQVCPRLVQIEDATVCEITGCVVHSHNLVANAFDDTAMLRKPGGSTRAPLCLHDDVERYVRALLTSPASAEAHRMQLAKLTCKLRSIVLGSCAEHASVFALLESSVSRLHSTRVVPESFQAAQRHGMVAVASQHIAFLLASTRARMPHMLRGLETRTLVFGLLYLMRTGISAHSVCLMPALASLVHMLPNESFLPKLFDFKAKHITEVENRFKFILRQCCAEDIQRMGFRDVDAHVARAAH